MMKRFTTNGLNNKETKKTRTSKKKIAIAVAFLCVAITGITTAVVLTQKPVKPIAVAEATETDATEEVTTEVAEVTTTEVTTTEVASGGRKETTKEKSKKTTEATTEASSTKTPEKKTTSTQASTTQAPATEASRPEPTTTHSHNYKLTNTVDATCTKDGYKEYACSCGDSYRETLSAKGHSWKTVTETIHHDAEYETRDVCYFSYDGYKCYTNEEAFAHQDYLSDLCLAGQNVDCGYSIYPEQVLVKDAWDE